MDGLDRSPSRVKMSEVHGKYRSLASDMAFALAFIEDSL